MCAHIYIISKYGVYVNIQRFARLDTEAKKVYYILNEKISFPTEVYMAKQCKNCGYYLLDDEKFCTRCGTNCYSNSDGNAVSSGAAKFTAQPATDAQPQQTTGAVPPPQPYPQNNYSYQPASGTAQGRQAAPDDGSASMSVGSWVGTILLTHCLGFISLILLIVWGFSVNTPKAKANYCKAMLVFWLVAGVLAFFFFVVLALAIEGSGINLADIMERIEDAFM